MNYISAESISKSYQEKWLFKDISIGLNKGDKIALVGVNGSGKSTLLKILAGIVMPDGGKVAVSKDIRAAYLDQDPEFVTGTTVTEALLHSDSPVLNAIEQYEKAVRTGDNDQMQQAMEKMDAMQAWNHEQRVKEIISRMGIENLEQEVSTLSGGQKKRVALARILIEEPDMLIMDEPTNHLDLETVEWLQEHLSTHNMTLLLVTHDRYFLDAVCKEIVELDNSQLYRYRGNYAYFLEKKLERESQASVETDKARNLMRKELDWMRRQPKARGTKAKYRIDAFHELEEKAAGPAKKGQLEINVKASRQGNKIIEVEKLNKTYDNKKIVDDFSYIFKKREKIGIIGKNGSGKTTFLNMLTGITAPDSGKITVGDTTVLGYYKQEKLPFKEEQRVIEVVEEVADVIKLDDGREISASKFLDTFNFPPAIQYTPVARLSGGERKRLQLLMVLLKSPNFLILDEPTNDIDLLTLNVLEEFLLNFGGCLMVVTHDRYFLDQLTDHLFVFEGEGKIRDFPGNYTDYRNWLKEQEEEGKKKEPEQKQVRNELKTEVSDKNKPQKLSFKEKKELEELEVRIPQLEAKKEELIDQMNSGNGDHVQIGKWASEIEILIAEIDKSTERWLELSERS